MSTAGHRIGAAVMAVALAAGGGVLAEAETLLHIQGDWEKTDEGRALCQSVRFANDAVAYGLTYEIAIPDGTPAGRCTSSRWAFTTGYVTLGMTSPVLANWYGQSFLAVHVDGLSLHDIPLNLRPLRQGGPASLLEGTWQTAKGPVHVRVLLRDGDDKLIVQIGLAAETQARRLEVKLLAYPQGFEKPWSRRMATASGEMASPATVNLHERREAWALLYDEGMDRDGTGGGPCGLVYVPDEVESAVVNLGEYGVVTTLRTKPDVRKITVGLWDFTFNREVDAVRRCLRRAGAVVAQDVASVARTDWRSEALPPAQLPADYAELLARQARRRRQPTPYDEMTSRIVTPHVPWGKPLVGGPVRTLVVAPRWHQRETVELAQRLDMQYQTVSFSGPDKLLEPSWLYLYGSYDVYGYARKNETDVLFELAAQLGHDPDCIVLGGFKPEIVPEHLRRRVAEKVRAGAGLLLFGGAREILDTFGDDLQPTEWNPSVVPVAALPGLDRLVARNQPLWTAYAFGEGRVLAFHYKTELALTPALSHEDPDVLGYYDYYHSLIAAGVLWAARRELPVRVRFPGSPGQVELVSDRALDRAVVEVMAHDPARGFRERALQSFPLASGQSTVELPTPGPLAGRRLISVWIKHDRQVLGWGTGHADPGSDQPRIAAVEVPDDVVDPGKPVAGEVRLTAMPAQAVVELEVWDSIGRLLARRRITPTDLVVPFQLSLQAPIAVLHELRVLLHSGQSWLDQHIVPFTVPDATVDDFHFLVWSNGANQAVRHHVNRILAEHGVDWIDNTGLTGGDALRAEVYCRNAARYGLKSIPYITRICSMQETGRQRRPCLNDPEHQRAWAAGLEERARGAAPFGPPAYTLGDENFLVHRNLDVCIGPHTLAEFRRWLEREHGSIDRLNQSWQTAYACWDEIVPAAFEEVKDIPAHWPRWADHRRFMDRVFTGAHALGREAIRRADPKARVGFDGVFSLDSWHGYDFYQLSKACDLVQVYAVRPMQIELLRSWHTPDAIVGAWYNSIGNRDETSAKRLGWHLLFHEFNSSWYWTSYNTGPALLFPDLRPTPQFRWLEQSHAEIMGGIGKLLLYCRREQDGIAIHYSQPSVHAGTLISRDHAAAIWGFARLVEDLGLQYDVLSYDQIEQGGLRGYKVLLLPASNALSPGEAKAIRAFVERGGLVIADTVPAILDEHCRLLEPGRLDDLFGVRRSGLPAGGASQVLSVNAEALQLQLPLSAYDTGLEPAEAEAWAAAGSAPGVLVRSVSDGAAVVLNTQIEVYELLHRAGEGRAVEQLMARLLARADVTPQVRIQAGGEAVGSSEIVRFRDGRLQYVSIVRDNHLEDVKPEEVEIRFPLEAQAYDVRAKQPLGWTQFVRTTLVPGDPKIYALLPYSIESVKVRPAAGQFRTGKVASFDLAMEVNGRQPMGRHCLRIELVGPDGKPVRHYARNVLTENAVTTVSVPLAFNDPAGTWQLRATDVATGCSGSAVFVVRAPREPAVGQSL
jgi:beta-galactosidase